MKRKRKPKTATTRSRRTPANFCTTVFVCLAFYLTNTNTLQAQHHAGDYALIFGTVWGPDDRPVYGVSVKIRKAGENKVRWEVHSNHLGEFEQRVPAGRQDYVLAADLRGYKSPQYQHLQPGEEVTVHVERDERVDTGLHLK